METSKLHLAKMERAAKRLLKARAQLNRLYQEVDQLEDTIINGLGPAPCFAPVKLRSVTVQFFSPFYDRKANRYKHRIYRSKCLKFMEIEVTE